MDLARVAYGFENLDPKHYVKSSTGRWTNNERFDLIALSNRPWSPVAAGERLPPELRLMLRGLLEDRFELKVDFETRRAPVVALRLIEAGKPGPMLRQSTNDCELPELNPQAGAPKGTGPCASVLDRDRIEAPGFTMRQFAELLSTTYIADRPIVDDTRLEGRFDIVVMTGLQSMPAETPSARDLQAAARYPSVLREAMKAQLGLELRSAKLPVQTLLIERATRPLLD